ncbi:MAG: DUF2723 domain-containing protein [Gemmatimonadales bacterium]|nr:DUF2723 domain-containing protein [Gemmatimonadales bacterium]
MLGIPHPTGYPLWTLLARLFDSLPVGHTSACRVGLLSALSVALAAAMVAWIAYVAASGDARAKDTAVPEDRSSGRRSRGGKAHPRRKPLPGALIAGGVPESPSPSGFPPGARLCSPKSTGWGHCCLGSFW